MENSQHDTEVHKNDPDLVNLFLEKTNRPTQFIILGVLITFVSFFLPLVSIQGTSLYLKSEAYLEEENFEQIVIEATLGYYKDSHSQEVVESIKQLEQTLKSFERNLNCWDMLSIIRGYSHVEHTISVHYKEARVDVKEMGAVNRPISKTFYFLMISPLVLLVLFLIGIFKCSKIPWPIFSISAATGMFLTLFILAVIILDYINYANGHLHILLPTSWIYLTGASTILVGSFMMSKIKTLLLGIVLFIFIPFFLWVDFALLVFFT